MNLGQNINWLNEHIIMVKVISNQNNILDFQISTNLSICYLQYHSWILVYLIIFKTVTSWRHQPISCKEPTGLFCAHHIYSLCLKYALKNSWYPIAETKWNNQQFPIWCVTTQITPSSSPVSCYFLRCCIILTWLMSFWFLLL